MGLRSLFGGGKDNAESTTHDRILDHYRSFWGADRVEDRHWTPEHMATRLRDFHIARVKPETPEGMWTFATIGAWRGTEAEDKGLEFVAVSLADETQVMHRLGMLAYYQAGPTENRLGVGHTLDIGEGWVKDSTLDAILISLPYLWGPKLEHCQLPDRHIQVLWALPITSAERAYARDQGFDALEQKFEEAGLNYLDPFRASIV